MGLEEGKHVSFTYEGSELSGLVVQISEEEATVKLKSGYNMLVSVSKVSDVKEMEDSKTPSAEPKKIKQDQTLPKVTILHTGGTIASKVDYATGGVLASFEPEEMLEMFPELQTVANVNSVFVRNMWSQDIRFPHYNILGRAVLDEINKGAAGVIVTHGTDFLHTTAAALSFMLEGLNIPVMLVGSQRSSDRGSSDATTNLMGAVNFITQTRQPGVFVAMHETTNDDPIAIIDGVHARKMHSSRRDAFTTVNAKLFGRVKEGKAEILDGDRAKAWKEKSELKPRVLPFKEDLKIGLWKTHPQSFVDELSIYGSYDGLIIEGSGLGHGPTSGIDEFTKEHPEIRERIGELCKKIPVVMTVQTIYGRVDMNVYSPQRELLDLGIWGNDLDMMPEVAFVKLGWAISNFNGEEVRAQFHTDLRGEISKRSPLEDTHGGNK